MDALSGNPEIGISRNIRLIHMGGEGSRENALLDSRTDDTVNSPSGLVEDIPIARFARAACQFGLSSGFPGTDAGVVAGFTASVFGSLGGRISTASSCDSTACSGLSAM